MAQQKNDNTGILVLAGMTLFFYNEIFGKSEADKKAEADEKKIEATLETNPFDYEHFKAKVPSDLIKSKKFRITSVNAGVTMRQAAKDIKNGWKFFDDDESQVINAFRQAKTKGDIALISKYYSFDFKQDLLYDLKTKMSKSERGNIYNFVNKLPEYIKLK
jgi:hypothetical protein